MRVILVSAGADKVSLSDRAEAIAELQREEKKLYRLSAEIAAQSVELNQKYHADMKALGKRQEILTNRLIALQDSMLKFMVS